jgi:hypothetical protein
MSIVDRAVGVVFTTAEATAAAAGAVGGAAVNGIIGGVQGTAAGIRSGLSNGSHSTPAAVLTLAAVGATGLVDWPVLLAVGGTTLVVRQPTRRTGIVPASTLRILRPTARVDHRFVGCRTNARSLPLCVMRGGTILW